MNENTSYIQRLSLSQVDIRKNKLTQFFHCFLEWQLASTIENEENTWQGGFGLEKTKKQLSKKSQGDWRFYLTGFFLL